jgi:hypothetical protein
MSAEVQEQKYYQLVKVTHSQRDVRKFHSGLEVSRVNSSTVSLNLRSRTVTICASRLKITHSVFCIHEFCMILSVDRNISLNSVNQLIVVMVKCSVLFEVRTGFLNNI